MKPCLADDAKLPCRHMQDNQCASNDCKGICLPGSCGSDNDCAAAGNYFCFIGTCAPRAANGVPCVSVRLTAIT